MWNRSGLLLTLLSLCCAVAPARCDDDDPAWGDNPAAALGDKANFVNGYMFVGFSPQDHPNGGAGSPKYDAYNYLVLNKVDPNSKTWAPGAAAGLNKKYPCKFWAQDGETLIYEDEYIHSAPPGHGAPGGAIPGAKGEFFWGGMDGYVPPGNPCGGPSGQVNAPANGGSAAPAPSSGTAPMPTPPGDDTGFGNDIPNPPDVAQDFSNVNWLNGRGGNDVSGYTKTVSLNSVSFSGNTMVFDYKGADNWPEGAPFAGWTGVIGNPWILFYREGKWQATTCDWMGRKKPLVKEIFGGTCGLGGARTLGDFQPQKGERYGFMISSFGGRTNFITSVMERSNVVMATWP